ncbi:MAG TPA: hypothetical protein VNS58_22945 [Puia sp.]|nr:hypothetical protein [Puia sp.]
MPDGKIIDRGFLRTSNLDEPTNGNDVLNRVVWPGGVAPGRLAGRQPPAIRIFVGGRALNVFHQKAPYMENITRSGRILFAIPWIIFCIQHFIYADFVTTLVPAYMPFRLFWVYFTAITMFAAGISFIINVKVRLAATLLGIMLSIFVLQVHTGMMTADLYSTMNWTRTLQDIALAGAAFALAGSGALAGGTGKRRFFVVGKVDLNTVARYLYALPLILLGGQHFFAVSFVTGRIPAWFPLRIFWDYLMGCLIIVMSVCIVLNKKALLAARVLGAALLLFALLLHVPLLVTDSRNGQEWTSSMLDLAIAAGALLIARPTPFANS